MTRYPNLPENWAPDQDLRRRFESPAFPEIFIGILRAQGADVDGKTLKSLENELALHGFKTVRIEVADLIDRCVDSPDNGGANPSWTAPSARIRSLMDMGDLLRAAIHPSAAAMMAVTEISQRREQAQEQAARGGSKGIAYVIRHLVGADEVSRLRSVYKQRFFAVALLQDSRGRQDGLVKKLSQGMTKAEGPNESTRAIANR